MKTLSEMEPDIKKLELRPGDVVVFSIPQAVSLEYIEHLKGNCSVLFPENTCVILTDGATASILRETPIETVLEEVMDHFRINKFGVLQALAVRVAALVEDEVRRKIQSGV